MLVGEERQDEVQHVAQVLLHLLVRPLKTLTLSVSQVNDCEDGGAGASSSPCTTPAGP